MVLNDASYYTRRALSQIDCASHAFDEKVADVHVRLTLLYLRRALSDAEGALMPEPVAAMPLRIVA